jgi:hypothetical protein
LGDLEVAPYGSPLTFGFDSSSEGAVRAVMFAGVSSKALSMPDPNAIAQAEDDYRQSNRPEPELAIRKAYIAWLRVGRDAAPAYGEASVTAGTDYPLLKALSLTSRGFLLADKQLFAAGLHEAKIDGFSGLAVSLIDMADSVASRLQIVDPIRALDVLNLAAIAGADEGFPASASRLELSLAYRNTMLQRLDFAINAQKRAAEHLKLWTERMDKTVKEEKLTSAPLLPSATLAARQRLIGVLIQLAAALNQNYFEEGRDEWSRRRDDYEDEVRVLLHDANESAHQQWNTYLSDRESYAALAVQVAKLHTEGCDAAQQTYRTAKMKPQARLADWVPFAAIAAACDPAVRDEVVNSIASYDPTNELEQALETVAKQPGFAAAQKFQQNLYNLSAYFDALVALGQGSRLETGVTHLSGLIQANPSIIGRITPYANLYRAIALSLQGRNAESQDLLLQLRKADSVANADPSFRRRIDAVLIETEASLKDAASSLIALEAVRSETEELQDFASGIQLGNSDTVRLAMLLRQQAIATLPPPQQQEIIDLEKRLRPNTVVPGIRVDIKTITDPIPPGVIVLAYYPTRTNMLIWRLENGRPPLLTHSNAAPWEIKRWTGELSRKLLDQKAGWEGAATNLYRELVERVGPLEAGSTLAVFGMSSLPFDLLSPKAGQFLISSHPIVYLAGLISVDQRKTTTSAANALVVGAAGASLDEVGPEVEAVAKLLHTTPQVAGDATLNQVRAALPSARFVHIASHGVIDSINPYRSYLALTDGNLEAWELFRLAAHAELVVFSACDTLRPILGPIKEDSTTIAGLTTLGGAPRVLSSLWAADDRDARELMISFYQNLGMNPAAALQKSKLSLGHLYRSTNFTLTVSSPSTIMLPSQ